MTKLHSICTRISKMQKPTVENLSNIIRELEKPEKKETTMQVSLRHAILANLNVLNESVLQFNSDWFTDKKVSSSRQKLIWQAIQSAADLITDPKNIAKQGRFDTCISKAYAKTKKTGWTSAANTLKVLFGCLSAFVGIILSLSLIGAVAGLPLMYFGGELLKSDEKSDYYDRAANQLSSGANSEVTPPSTEQTSPTITLKQAINNLRDCPQQDQSTDNPRRARS